MPPDREVLLAGLPVGHLIDGEWVEAGDGPTVEHVDPATGRPTRPVPAAGPAEVDRAVGAARRSLDRWKRYQPAERAEVLGDLAARLDACRDELVQVGALERGAPVGATRGRPGAAFDYAASWCDKLTGATIPVAPGRVVDFTLVEPVGVVAVLPTWNGPLWSVGVAVAPALAVGCTVVLKSPELAPFSCGVFARICREAGVPDGVVNVLSGGAEAGAALVAHPDVDKIHFTGGLATAQRIQVGAAEAVTPMVLELGGKSPLIVFPDADLDQAAQAAAGWVKLNAGQSCTGASRLLAHGSIADELTQRVGEVMGSVVVGDPFDPATEMGPLIDEAACQRVGAVVEGAVGSGAARLAAGGARLGGPLGAGAFFPPTLLVDVDPLSSVARDEVFGPVVTVTRFETEEEAVALANDSRFGLAAYVHTRDISRALRLAGELDAGNVGINGVGTTAPAGLQAPFGGFKDSGYGKENGIWGVSEFVRVKNVTVVI